MTLANNLLAAVIAESCAKHSQDRSRSHARQAARLKGRAGLSTTRRGERSLMAAWPTCDKFDHPCLLKRFSFVFFVLLPLNSLEFKANPRTPPAKSTCWSPSTTKTPLLAPAQVQMATNSRHYSCRLCIGPTGPS